MTGRYISHVFSAKNADVCSDTFRDLQRQYRMRRAIDEPNWAGFCALVLLGRSFTTLLEAEMWIMSNQTIGGKVCYGFRCGENWALMGWESAA